MGGGSPQPSKDHGHSLVNPQRRFLDYQMGEWYRMVMPVLRPGGFIFGS